MSDRIRLDQLRDEPWLATPDDVRALVETVEAAYAHPHIHRKRVRYAGDLDVCGLCEAFARFDFGESA